MRQGLENYSTLNIAAKLLTKASNCIDKSVSRLAHRSGYTILVCKYKEKLFLLFIFLLGDVCTREEFV